MVPDLVQDDIRREAQTMSLFNHQNVVKAYCSFVVGQNLWVVMPYMAGGSCLHIMKAAYPDGFEEPVIATVLKESLKALEYLHRHGHIHRDVKVLHCASNSILDLPCYCTFSPSQFWCAQSIQSIGSS
jgi:serine/threonine protein kinase